MRWGSDTSVWVPLSSKVVTCDGERDFSANALTPTKVEVEAVKSSDGRGQPSVPVAMSEVSADVLEMSTPPPAKEDVGGGATDAEEVAEVVDVEVRA